MNNIIRKLLGIFQGEVSVETKKRRLLRAACITWLSVLIVFTIKNLFIENEQSFEELIVNAITVFVIAIIFTVDLKGHSNVARYLIAFALTVSIINSAFFLFPGRNIEVFLIILGPFSVFFIHRPIVQFFIFSLAFGAFIFLPKLMGVESAIHDVFMLKMVFVVVFIIVKDVDGVNKKTEKSLSKQKFKAEKDKELIEAQKQQLDELNEFKNRFFVNIAHELRTPLTLIGGFASLSKSKNVTPDISDKILEQSDKMKQIVDDILDLSKLSTNKLSLATKKEDVHSLLMKIHSSFLPVFQEKELVFNLSLASGKYESKIDLIYFERAINNILLNSLKFTEKGQVTLSSRFKDDVLEISVIDMGIGIAKEELSNVFTEFYQVDNDVNQASGSGIGLSFTNKIIELHDGALSIKSEVAHGTTVTISLKAEVSNKESFSLDQRSQPPFIIKESVDNNKILLVEDHKEMRAYLLDILKDYHVTEARNGLEAIQLLEKESFDFMITDYMMPKMNGYELIKNVKQKGYRIPVLMLTARADIEAKLDVLRLGIDDYMTKPFNADELLVRISNALTNNLEREEYLNSEEYDKFEEEPESEFTQLLSTFVNEKCTDDLFSLDDVKEEFALSSSSLYRKVKLETGMSPNEFVREVRMQKARQFVEINKVTSLKALALSVGIKNASYFSKQYEARFGTRLSKTLNK